VIDHAIVVAPLRSFAVLDLCRSSSERLSRRAHHELKAEDSATQAGKTKRPPLLVAFLF
jgi:hypothetical protein